MVGPVRVTAVPLVWAHWYVNAAPSGSDDADPSNVTTRTRTYGLIRTSTRDRRLLDLRAPHLELRQPHIVRRRLTEDI